MAETDDAPGPLTFAASFPPEERYASTAGDLAVRLAASAGCLGPLAADIRAAVEEAFQRAAADARPGGAAIELTLGASAAAFSADLTCGGCSVLHWTRPRAT